MDVENDRYGRSLEGQVGHMKSPDLKHSQVMDGKEVWSRDWGRGTEAWWEGVLSA